MKTNETGHNEGNFIDSSDKENNNNNLNAISTIVNVPIDELSDEVLSDEPPNKLRAIDAENNKQPLLFSGKYYQIIFKDSVGAKAKCVTCGSVYTKRGSTTSNLITHLKVRKICYFFLTMIHIEFVSLLNRNMVLFIKNTWMRNKRSAADQRASKHCLRAS